MKIKHFKDWLNTLPEEFEEYEMVYRKVIAVDNKNMIAEDKCVDACGIDADNKEAYLCNKSTHLIIEENS